MGTQLPLPKKGAQPPNFQPISIVAKRLDASRFSNLILGSAPNDYVILWKISENNNNKNSENVTVRNKTMIKSTKHAGKQRPTVDNILIVT